MKAIKPHFTELYGFDMMSFAFRPALALPCTEY